MNVRTIHSETRLSLLNATLGLLCGGLLLAAINTQAAVQYYSGASTNKVWDTSLLDWGSTSGGPYNAAWVNGNDAVFQGPAATVTNLGVSAHSLTFTNGTWIITNGVLTLNGTLPFITNSAAAVIASEIAGTAGFTKRGLAGLTLSVSNSFSGVLTNNPGSANVSGVTILNNYALGATGAGNETVVMGGNNGGGGNLLALGNGVVTPAGETVILQCGASQRAGLQNVSSGSINATWSGDVIMASPDGTAPVLYANSGSLTVLGNVRGNNLVGGGLFRGNGAGNLYGNIWLTNSPFYVADGGTWTIYSTGNLWTFAQINGGTLKLGTNDALCTSGSLALGQGNANTFRFDMNGFSQSVAVVTNNLGSVVNLFTNSSVNPSVFTINATTANSRIAPSGAGSILVCGPISIVKNGSFQLALGGANTYVGTNTINAGTLLVTNVGTLGDAANPLVLNAGTLNLGGSSQTVGDVTMVSGVITNGALTGNSYAVQSGSIYASLGASPAALTKTGNGTLLLAAANDYFGNTLVSGGALAVVTGGSCNNSAVTLAPSGSASVTNEVRVLTSGGQWFCASLTTTAGSGSVHLVFDYDPLTGPSTSVAPLTVNGDCAVSGTLNIRVRGGLGWTSGQTYPLVQIYGASAPVSITLNLTGEPFGLAGGALSYDAGNRTINYTVGSAPRALTWNGGSGVWDINGTANWLDALSNPAKFLQLDLVTFDDTPGAGPFTVTNNSALTPSSISNASFSANYTFTGTGTIGGETVLHQVGTATLTLASSNTYSGGTVVSGGTLALANPAALGSGALTMAGGSLDSAVPNLVNANNNPLNWNADFTFVASQNLNLGTGPVSLGANTQVTVNSNRLTVGGAIGGTSVTLSKAGAGELWLNGANSTFSAGQTVVNDGLLKLGATNALGSAQNGLTVNGGTLDLNGIGLGAGSFNGSAGTVLNNGGAGQVTLTVGNGNGGGTFSGTIADNSAGSGTLALAKVGTGALTLGGSNSYSGPTTISGGCLLNVADAHALGTTAGEVTQTEVNNCVRLSGNIVVSGKIINIQGTGGSPSGGNGNGALQGAAGQTNEWAGPVLSGAGTQSGRFGVQAGAAGLLVISGSIQNGATASGGGRDVVANCDSAGSGVMFSAPAGVNTYSGQTQIGRGFLKLGAVNTLPVTSILNIGTGGSGNAAVFDLNGFDQTVGGLTRSGGVTGTITNSSTATTNTLTVNQATNTTYSGILAGANVQLVKSGTGTLSLTGDNSAYAGLTTVSAGWLLVNNTNGTGTGTGSVLVNGGTLGGIGFIGGNVTNQAGGTLAPGTNGIGTLTFNGTDLTLQASSFTSVDVDATTATSDLVIGLNSVTYGGTLAVSNLSGALTTNSLFTLFSATASAGNFASISGSPGVGLAWSFNPTNGVLSVVPGSAAPVSTNITAQLIGNQLVLDWPAGQNWRLQSQTNALVTGLTTNWTVVTPTPTPPYTNTVVSGNPTVFFRLVYP